MINKKLSVVFFLVFIVLLFGAFTFTAEAGKDYVDFGYMQCSVHGHNDWKDCGWNYGYFPRSDYVRAEIEYRIEGHRHGGSEIWAIPCLNGGGKETCVQYHCTGSACGPEYGGVHPWDLLSQGTISVENYSWIVGSNYYIKRNTSVKDAEVRLHMWGWAEYCDAGQRNINSACVDITGTLNVSPTSCAAPCAVSANWTSNALDATWVYINGTLWSQSGQSGSGSISLGAGTYSFVLKGNDGSGTQITLDTETVTVNPPSGSISASPNPIQVCPPDTNGVTTLSGNTNVYSDIKIRQTGQLFAGVGPGSFSETTGDWVTNGMIFDLVFPATGATLSSVTVTHTTAGCPPPPPPTGLSASCPLPGTSATVSWNASAGATYYALRVNNTADPWDGSCASPGGDFCQDVSGTSYSFSTTPGATYGWWVHACNAVGCSSEVGGPTFTCTAPTHAGNLSRTVPACGTGTYTANFSWTGSGSGWYLDYTTDSSWSTWTPVNVSNQTSASVSGLSANTTYYWRIYDTVDHHYGSSFNVPVCAYTLTVASTNPSSGVSMTVSPSDNNGQSNGSTQFSRTYNSGTAVQVTAPSTASGNNFSSWTGCNSVTGTYTCNATMNASKTITANYTTPFNFSLSNGGNRSVVQGNSVANTITATLTSGTTQSVSFSASGLPSGATASFSPTSCSPTCSTTLAINTSLTTPTGNYTITVTGTGGGLTRTTSFILTVTLAPQPTISLSPTSFTFNGVSGGSTPPGQALRISNIGSAILNWTFSRTGSATWCNLSSSSGFIAAGSYQNVTVSVTAPINVGTFTDCGIRISDPSATNSPQDASVTYIVTPAPQISVTPSELDFLDIGVNSYKDMLFIVENTGGGTLTGSVSGLSSPFSCQSGCSYSLTAGQSQNVSIRFSPTLVNTFTQTANFSGGGGAARNVSGRATSWTITMTASPGTEVEPDTLVNITATSNHLITYSPYYVRIYEGETQLASCGAGRDCSFATSDNDVARTFTGKIESFDGSDIQAQASITVTWTGGEFPLPEYKEVPPQTWLNKIFAGIADFFNGFLNFNTKFDK